jgi:hypothetical protein
MAEEQLLLLEEVRERERDGTRVRAGTAQKKVIGIEALSRLAFGALQKGELPSAEIAAA